MSIRHSEKLNKTHNLPSVDNVSAPDQEFQYDPETGLSTQRSAQKARQNKLGHLGLAGGGVLLTALIAGGAYFGLSGGEKTEPKSDPSVSAPADPTETNAPVVSTPEEALGIKQSSYELVNNPEAANNPEFVERARQLVPAGTPLEEAVVIFGQKVNMYNLTGDEQILASIYGSDQLSSQLAEGNREMHGHSNNRFSYFEGYQPNQIIDKTTGESVDVTQYRSFEPLVQTQEYSMTMFVHNVTNFENVDRSEVFDNTELDNPYSKESEIHLQVKDGNLYVQSYN